MNRIAALLLAGSLALSACAGPAIAAEEPVNAPAATRTAKETKGLRTAIFAGGCFWGVEGVFSHVKGVKSAVAGFHGGNAASAKYDIIITGVTNHAEAVKITYDPAVVRYDELLRIFFSVVADPTLKNRQGPDVGAHYRSALVPMNKEQAAVARAYLAQLGKAGLWSKPIVTRIEPYKAFYPAEGYHQDFMAKNPRHGYIMRWDAPKVAALKAFYPDHYRAAFLRDAR
ncbi:peptide-methionine (S)-S-oxide reductase MsrA [Erythrobacter sanguineus]|jgi:peptide-methionine (S)-S-oxide reductase|uniref:Peptide methionine sulfoxide reductase MsrA n=1 Tax=Erythrobacter sanguineus TaxID=198312 RepID=A0A1M7T025_9SPHN|nr:peptide-methionine (S)-S-oxide reductase MsrA [Erythrobacter sanguineus]SHN64066.1 peptide-methionine (S)-S-oxide reductase [Erythrobacter sanguineus]